MQLAKILKFSNHLPLILQHPWIPHSVKQRPLSYLAYIVEARKVGKWWLIKCTPRAHSTVAKSRRKFLYPNIQISVQAWHYICGISTHEASREFFNKKRNPRRLCCTISKPKNFGFLLTSGLLSIKSDSNLHHAAPHIFTNLFLRVSHKLPLLLSIQLILYTISNQDSFQNTLRVFSLGAALF